MGTTPTYAIPYPEPGDLLASYPTNTGKPLALRVETLLTSLNAGLSKPSCAGSSVVTFDGTATPPAVAVTFPAGKFAGTPAVTVGSNNRTAYACAATVSTTGFSLGAYWIPGGSSTSTVTFMWIAQEKG